MLYIDYDYIIRLFIRKINLYCGDKWGVMKVTKTKLDGVLIIDPLSFGDSRGWFFESYSKSKFVNSGINVDFIQDNHSMSSKCGTLRGIHFQNTPKAQTKLIRCTKGKVLDIVVDLRKGSPTYKKWLSIELSENNKRELLIPKGFAHGFLTLTDNVEIQYKVDEYYSPEHDRSIKYNDPDLNINWNIEHPFLSDKDINAPFLKDSDINFRMKYLITGANGQLGSEIISKINESKLDIDVLTPSREEFDLTNKEQIKKYLLLERPDIIIHCAAYTQVDQAEIEKELCYTVNVEGTSVIAECSKFINATIIYISTDYIFDGSKNAPYETDDEVSPINYYGYTKSLGENIVKNSIDKYFIIRTAWLYGKNGKNFVKTMLSLAKSKNEIKVVNDQFGSPTSAKDLAKFVLELAQTTDYGTYHGVSEGYCSWYDLCNEIFDKIDSKVKVIPIPSKEYLTKASRPKNSRLSTKGQKNKLPNWKDALDRFLEKEIQ